MENTQTEYELCQRLTGRRLETDEDAEKRMLQETKERLASKFGEDGLASQVGDRLA